MKSVKENKFNEIYNPTFPNQKSISFYTLNVNNFLMKFAKKSIKKPTDYSSLISNRNNGEMDKNCFIDIASNGSTLRSVVMENFPEVPELEGKRISADYQLTILDEGFNINPRHKVYQMNLSKQTFKEGIFLTRIFVVNFGHFYMLLVDKSLKAWLMETSLHKFNLILTLDLNFFSSNPQKIDFVEVLTNTIDFPNYTDVLFSFNHIVYLAGNSINFKLI